MPLAHSDASAIRAWLENTDEPAAAWLFDKYLPLVVHVCSRKLPHSWMASDAAQDTISRAFQSLWNFDSERSFSSSIATIASRICVDYLRVFSRRVEIPMDDVSEVAMPDRDHESPHSPRSGGIAPSGIPRVGGVALFRRFHGA